MKSASTTVKKEELNGILEQWLKDGDLPATTPLQLYFLPGEIIIRPRSPEEQELTEWFNSFQQRYDETLEKLAEGPESWTLRYPGLAEVLTLHALLIDAYGGSGELRDAGALQSALAAPRHTMFGEELYPRPADKAAILLYLLIKNHPFVDGNKRAGLATCFRFLEMNGYTVDADGEALYNLAMGVAAGRLTRNEVTSWMQDHLQEICRED